MYDSFETNEPEDFFDSIRDAIESETDVTIDKPLLMYEGVYIIKIKPGMRAVIKMELVEEV